MSVDRIVPCPRCGKVARWQGNPARPFCSPRCREIDMAAWYAESYCIPAEGDGEGAQMSDVPVNTDVSEGEAVDGVIGLSNRSGNE